MSGQEQASAARHTPGPWVTQENAVGGLNIGVMRAIKGGEIFISIGNTRAVRNPLFLHGRTPIEDAEAITNGYVMTAAPKLLDALRTAVARIELANSEGDSILSAWLPDARAAIAKATGSAA